MAMQRMGLVKTSLVDFPGRVAATVFTYGCNLRCPYCHNADLVQGGTPEDFLPQEEILAFLGRRRRVLDGLAVTGGEPLLHADLTEFIARVRALGLAVKVDTNGTLPDRLSAVDADYVAMDLKTAPEHYARMGLAHLEGNAVTGVEASKTAERLHRSIQVLRERSAAGELSYELRTTVVPDLVSEADIARMAEMLIPGERIVLAPFRGGRTLDPAYSESAPPTPELMAEYAETLGRSGADVQVRES